MRRLPRTLGAAVVLAIAVGWTATPSAQLPEPGPGEQAVSRAQPGDETALDRYVAAPDAHFGWHRVRTSRSGDAMVSVLQLTSQQWLSEREVTQPIWKHWLTVTRPARVTTDVGLLFITGGDTGDKPPASAPDWLVDIARDTGTVVSELRMVPNQPVVFVDDAEHTLRYEDDFIAYTWDHFLATGDERWPARLPMTKAAVRAMDAITAFTTSPNGGAVPVRRFVVAGASKRGWTTWAAAAVDRRVIAIAPIVIDLLNLEASFSHQWQAYGYWAPAVSEYEDRGIMNWLGSPQFRALMRIEEPYEYRDRLTMPKLLLNAAGDEFFLPDSAQFYVDALPGETLLRYVPNVGHDIRRSDAIQTLHAFYASVAANRPRPSFSWSTDPDGALRVVVARDTPSAVQLWQATNPGARDFRISTIGRRYRATPLTPSGPNTWVARVPKPSTGWTAYFVELTFPSGGREPLTLTTPVRVVPETLPFPPPVARSR